MRLLTYDTSGELKVTPDLVDNIPPYAILSHTWGADEEEVTFSELQSGTSRAKAGYTKIDFCGWQARKEGLQHFWVDTCCIDKANHAELSEAIASMFRWYQNAQICYVYLADVSTSSGPEVQDIHNGSGRRSWKVAFRQSRWFTRGWTLQELLAPKEVTFFSKEGECLGSKSGLETLLSEITSIPTAALHGQPLSQFSVSERMRWTKGRVTKKKEDQAYCLLGIFNVYMPLIYGEGDNAFVRLTKEINEVPKVTFSLRVAEGAMFDAYGQTHQGCHPATRVDLLQSIRHWTQDKSGKSIFWLNGMAGTGKSTISWTIAKWLDDLGPGGPVALGASFFFKRGEGDRASAALLFPTIANQLAAKISHFDVFLGQAAKANPQICSKSLGEQFNKLICEPLRQLPSDTRHSVYVVVVDALDECDNEADIRTVLQLWSTLTPTNCARLRLFLTSRPERVIRLGFKKMPTDLHQDVVLHEVPPLIIQHDILAFLTDALAEIREDYNLEAAEDALADDWPGFRSLQELTDMAVPLFIVAATIFRFIRDALQPQKGLETILQSRKAGHLSDTGQVYLVVLQAMEASVRDASAKEKLYRDFRMIVGAIICLAEPLSRTALAALLGIPSSDVRLRLQCLHTLLEVPSDGGALIRPLHLSFGEFLSSPEIADHPFAVNSTATHAMLFTKCIELLSRPDPKGLRKNMCNLGYPGQSRRDLGHAQVTAHLPPEMQYACRYWTYHVQQSKNGVRDGDVVHTFLKQHFLHWLEALSLMDCLANALDYVGTLQSLVAKEDSICVSAFLEDARHFLLANQYICGEAPLQLYSSAIVFAPQQSIVRQIYSKIPSWIQQGPLTPEIWSAELQLEGHGDVVWAVAFSPDGSQLASGSGDTTVRLWDAQTGQEVQKLVGHSDGVWVVAFSPDGSRLASGSRDTTVELWDVQTGQEVQKLVGHSDGVWLVAFSPDGSRLASGSGGTAVRLWDAQTGQEVLKLQGHNGVVWTVAFSPDGSQLASGSGDKTVRLWDVQTGQEVQKLQGHSGGVWAVAFSPDGSQLASGSEDTTVRLWDAQTGQEVQKLQGHSNMVRAVAISPDGSQLASGSGDKTIRLWDAQIGREVCVLEDNLYVDKIRFANAGQSILTNRGTIDIGKASYLSKNRAWGTGNRFVLKEDWIECGNRRVLWLPHEYRSDVLAVHDNMLAIGRPSGLVSFLQIMYQEEID